MLNYAEIEFGTPEYDQSIVLRDKILRKPLGLEFNPVDLSEEWNQFHIAGFNDRQEIKAILVFIRLDENRLKMRQVAIDESLQGQGYGKALVRFSEAWAKHRKFKSLELNARENAIPFYLKLEYQKIGKPFEEVNIPHFKMTKKL